MRVLFINEKWGLSGGQEEYIRCVGNGLVDRGHNVSLFYGGLVGQPVDSKGVKFNSVLIEDLNLEKINGHLRQIKPDVINLQNVFDPFLVKKLQESYPTTRFVHDHSSYCPGNSKYFFNSQKICPIAASPLCLVNAYKEKCMTRRPHQAVRRLVERLSWLETLKNLPLVLCNSSYVKERLVQNGLKERQIVVNPLFPGHGESLIAGESDDGKEGVPKILFVGRLFKEKGVDLLLKAASGIKQDYKLQIVGQGWELDNLKKQARELGLEKKVDFLGFKSGSELINLYKQCRFLVMPSVWPEPFGMVGLEANASAKPVIAFRLGGIPDWLENNVNGLLVDKVDERLLSRAIERLLNDNKHCRRLGLGGSEKVKSRFNLERHLEVLEQLYSKIKK